MSVPSKNSQLHYLKARRKDNNARYELRTLVFSPSMQRAQARSLLASEVENGKWELTRTVVYVGGTTKHWLRRKIIHVPAS